MIDLIPISGKNRHGRLEFASHQHDHFLNPVNVCGGTYMMPNYLVFSFEFKPKNFVDFPSKVDKD